MNYLYTVNASKPYSGVSFDKAVMVASSWKGVFATDDDDLAKELLSYVQIKEITEEEYDDLKKKATNIIEQSLQKPKNVGPKEPPEDPVAAERSKKVIIDNPIEEIKTSRVGKFNDPLTK